MKKIINLKYAAVFASLLLCGLPFSARATVLNDLTAEITALETRAQTLESDITRAGNNPQATVEVKETLTADLVAIRSRVQDIKSLLLSAPSAPSLQANAGAVCESPIELSYAAPVKGTVLTYELNRNPDANQSPSWGAIARRTDLASLPPRDVSLKSETTYQYQLHAIGPGGLDAYSNPPIQAVSPKACSSAVSADYSLSKPNNVAVIAGDSGSTKVSASLVSPPPAPPTNTMATPKTFYNFNWSMVTYKGEVPYRTGTSDTNVGSPGLPFTVGLDKTSYAPGDIIKVSTSFYSYTYGGGNSTNRYLQAVLESVPVDNKIASWDTSLPNAVSFSGLSDSGYGHYSGSYNDSKTFTIPSGWISGTYYVNFRGVASNSSSASKQVTLYSIPFTIVASPVPVSVTLSVTSISGPGPTGPIVNGNMGSLTTAGGLGISLSPVSGTPTAVNPFTTNINVTSVATTKPGIYTVTITGSPNPEGASHQTTFTVEIKVPTVSASFDYSLSKPSNVTVTQGQGGSVVVKTTIVKGLAKVVTLTPNVQGLTGIIHPPNITPVSSAVTPTGGGVNTAFNFTTQADTTPGDYTVTVTGRGNASLAPPVITSVLSKFFSGSGGGSVSMGSGGVGGGGWFSAGCNTQLAWSPVPGAVNYSTLYMAGDLGSITDFANMSLISVDSPFGGFGPDTSAYNSSTAYTMPAHIGGLYPFPPESYSYVVYASDTSLEDAYIFNEAGEWMGFGPVNYSPPSSNYAYFEMAPYFCKVTLKPTTTVQLNNQ